MAKAVVEEIEESDEVLQVLGFRANSLIRAGFTAVVAEKIAEDTTVDWHLAADLRSKLDDENLIMEILL